MKILLVNYMETKAPGGINKVVSEIAKNLSKKGHEVVVLQPNPLDFPSEEIYEGFRIIRIKSRFKSWLYDLCPEIYFYLKRGFKKLNPDIVHVHGYHRLFPLEVIFILKKLNPQIPIIFSPHFGIFSHDTFAGRHLWGLYNQTIGKKIMKNPQMIVAASNFEANNMNKFLDVPNEKIMVIPHGVDDISIYDKTWSDDIHLLFVGYLLKLKGVQYVIETLHELIYKRKVQAHLTIIGEGPYKSKLKKIADNLNVNKFISWKGFIPPSNSVELYRYFKEADVLLLLSESENYGIVVSESLSRGTPTIVTKRTALKEFMDEPGCFGVDYPPDPKKVADIVIEIKRKKVKVGPLTDRIRSWDDVAENYEKVYMKFI